MSDTIGRERMLRTRARGIAILVTTLALAGGSTALAPAAFAAPPAATLTIEAAPSAATEGETVEVTLTATDATDLYAYDLVVSYDPELLELDPESGTGPDGGFTSVAAEDGLVALTHTRLGTSPGLGGTLELGSFSFVALGGGTATLTIESASLVSSTGETATLTDVDATEVELTALPDPEPEPEPEPEPVPTATSTPSPTAITLPSSGDTTPGQPLAATGADATPWLFAGAGAAALLAVGTLLVLRRRQAVSE